MPKIIQAFADALLRFVVRRRWVLVGSSLILGFLLCVSSIKYGGTEKTSAEPKSLLDRTKPGFFLLGTFFFSIGGAGVLAEAFSVWKPGPRRQKFEILRGLLDDGIISRQQYTQVTNDILDIDPVRVRTTEMASFREWMSKQQTKDWDDDFRKKLHIAIAEYLGRQGE